MVRSSEPAYVELLLSGELRQRVRAANLQIEACDLCGHRCLVDRHKSAGRCRTGIRAIIASHGPHFGEEAPLRGWRGSGTVFFSRCNLDCQFCQNHEISQSDQGQEVEAEDLASIMLSLQSMGCHNINLVSPTHAVPQILAGLLIAAQAGLRLPLVYNTGGYDSRQTLALLDNVIDVYMPDMKYASEETARRFSKAAAYPAINQTAVKEMHRQVGDLELDRNGIAVRGLLVRHLLLPGGLAGTPAVVAFLAENVSRDTYINIMDQYRPCYRANEMPPLDRRITGAEYRRAVEYALAAGLHRFDRWTPSSRDVDGGARG